jgi:ABC-2 type transport system permease protein
MGEIAVLLKPRLWAARARGKRRRRERRLKLAVLGTIGLAFWAGIFALSLRILFYFKGVEQLGELLAYKLLSMVLLTFFSLLIFSSILTILSKLYLSRDLPLVHAMPVAGHKIFLARWIESTADSAWMVMVYALPVFIAYGIVFRAGPFFYVNILVNLASLSIIASAVSALLVMAAVMIVPASRIRTIFVFLTLTFFLILFFAFRLIRPERLVDPEFFETTLVYLKALRTPLPVYLPSTWAFDSFQAVLSGRPLAGLFHDALLLSCAGLLTCLAVIFAHRVYYDGMSKTQTAPARLFKRPASGRGMSAVIAGAPGALAAKEVKTFFRDQTQWTQLFLIGALIVIYVYNFKVLPLDRSPIKTVYLQNLLAFLNMGLAAFVLSALTARFAYPAVSMEREAFWLIRTAPVSLKSFLWTKFVIYFIPLLALTEILIVATNLLLRVTPFMMVLSIVNVLFMVPGVVALGIGFGAAYPDFTSENPIQSVTSFGGLMFMIVSALFIASVLVLESGPVYTIFMAGFHGHALSGLQMAWIFAAFALAAGLCLVAFLLPMRYGIRRLEKERT